MTECATFLATRNRPSLYFSASPAFLTARWTFFEPAKTMKRSLIHRTEKWAASPLALCVHTTLGFGLWYSFTRPLYPRLGILIFI